MSVCIQTRHLTKCYGRVVAVSSMSLEIHAGEVVCLLGANGAGKSTTLYMLSGLVPPSAGSVTLFGKDIRKDFLDIAPRMGVLVERPAFYDHLTARRNLMVFAKLAGRAITVDRALDRVGLLRVAGRRVGTFSMGMRQRLGLAQAMLTEPELLILDEPTSGLDAESTGEILRLLRHLADNAGVTIVFSSHMLHEVETLADRVAILNRGRLLSCEHTSKLVSYDTSNVEILLENPEAAAKKLTGMEWVESVSVLPNRIQVSLKDTSIHSLIAFLQSSGFVLSGAIPKRRTLQEYFLKVLNE